MQALLLGLGSGLAAFFLLSSTDKTKTPAPKPPKSEAELLAEGEAAGRAKERAELLAKQEEERKTAEFLEKQEAKRLAKLEGKTDEQ